MEILKVENLSFAYPDPKEENMDTVWTLDELSFQIEEGAFVVICGESGCGKTTLLRLLKRELAPAGRKKGKIYFRGVAQEKLSDYESACEIGYVLQNPDHQIVTDKVWHELAFGLENIGMPSDLIRRRVAEMACFFGIDDWFHKKTEDLSGGQKQLLNLASVMVMQPKMLILDEPTSQLDPIAANNFINTLIRINQELGLTILMTEHRLEEVFPAADQIIVLDRGKLLLMEKPEQAGRLLKQKHANHKMLLSLPSAVRIYQGLDAKEAPCPLTVREGRRFLEKQYTNEIRRLEKPKNSIDDKKIAMQVKDISFRYEKEEPDILQSVHMTLYEGEIVSVLGGNGAGKTTLLRVLSGTHRPYRGKIELFGKRMEKYRGNELYVRMLTALPQNPQTVFLKMTVRQDYEELRPVMGYTKEEMEERIADIAGRLQITHLLERHPYDLSGGEQQRAAIGKILLLQPRVLLLDEPTKGIDAWSKKQLALLLAGLKQEGITILMVTHDVEFAAEISDRCGLFFDHEVTSMDTPEGFFCNNTYYTTAANRISRQHFDNAVTCEDVIALCRQNHRKTGENGI